MTVDRVTILCELQKTHAPLVFLDKAGTRPLPPADFLAKFQVVITTTQRFMHECKHGSFQEELERNELGDVSSYRDPLYQGDDVADESCELLKVYWNRLVVDEGHSLGKNQKNSTIQFASWINAKNRWAMTGTPTKQSSAEIQQLKGLMLFMQHGFFSSRLNGDIFWKRNVQKAWTEGHLVSFFRLRSLLGYFMKRHTKLDIAELPCPSYSKTVIPMSCLEATTYKCVLKEFICFSICKSHGFCSYFCSTVVGGIQMNILLTSMEARTSGLQDSLLHRSQRKEARLALQNVRRVCSGFSLRVVPKLEDRFYIQTIDMAKNVHHLSDETITHIKEFMHRAENEQLSPCMFCGLQLSTLLLMSCCGGQSRSIGWYRILF